MDNQEDKYGFNYDELSNKRALTTETNMLVEYLANSEKLVPPEQRWSYDGSGTNANNDDYRNDDLDDDITRYKLDDRRKTSEHENVEHMSAQHETRENRESVPKSTPKVDSESYSHSAKPQATEDEGLTKEEFMLRKLDMVRKLGELKRYGVKISKNYSMADDYDTMKFEYELHMSIRSKQNAVSWMSNMMVGIVKGIEMFNDNYNPFDIKLEGWSDGIRNDIKNYYDVLGEIYEKYTSPGKKMAPELKLFLMLTGSAVGIQFHKTIANQISGEANKLDNDQVAVEELRKKAENDKKRNENGSNSIDEHNQVAQRVAELHSLKENEQELHRLKSLIENEQSKLNAFTSGMILSQDSHKSRASSPVPNHSGGMHDLKTELMKRHIEQQEYVKNLYSQQQEMNKLNGIIEDFHNKYERSPQQKTTSRLSERKLIDDSDSINMSESSTRSSIRINKDLRNKLDKQINSKIIVPKEIIDKSEIDIDRNAISMGSHRSKDSNKRKGKVNIGIGRR